MALAAAAAATMSLRPTGVTSPVTAHSASCHTNSSVEPRLPAWRAAALICSKMPAVKCRVGVQTDVCTAGCGPWHRFFGRSRVHKQDALQTVPFHSAAA